MLDNSKAFVLRLKAATRDLVAACGGVERAAEISGLGKSTISRFQAPDTPGEPTSIISIMATVALEADCGMAFVTRVMAEAGGRRLTDPGRDPASIGNLLGKFSAVMSTAAEEARAVADMAAMGHATAGELDLIDRAAGESDRAQTEFRQTLADAKVVVLRASGAA